MKKSFSFILSIILVLSMLSTLPLIAYANVTPVTQNGITYYVADNGRTSAVVKDDGITWLKEESYGSSAWYGIDNSQGLIESGSFFWVMWLDAENDADIYQYYFNLLDDTPEAQNYTQRLFLHGVVNPNGTEESGFANSVPMYIQLGDDWDEDDIKNTFFGSSDSPVEISYREMECPEGTRMFAEVKSDVFIENGGFDGFPNLNGTASVSASTFSGGSKVLFAGGGFILGIAVAALGMTTVKKRKNKEAENA